ncbi:hypothetical protein [Posidoniimonas polymericola]|uniref:hypothetical protein n=1 Tax=Posidoniimonas polymericola TaxID=2528002 RepID=UPI0011B5C657|nr:hypothetical protein [Posidoniimonas polymericola]
MTTAVVLSRAAVAIVVALAAQADAQPLPADPPVAPAPQPATAGDGHDAAEPAPAIGEKWVRLQRDADGQPVALQTAIVRYTGRWHGDPVEVDLIGAVHVGDPAYYQDLNRRFTKYDALLFELVAPQGTVIPKGTRADTRHPLGAMQGGMKTILELEHQLEQVDYTRANFVHADMSPEEFFETMQDRDEGVLQMFMRMMGQSIAAQSEQQAEGQSADAEILMALFAKDRARRLKIVMAKQFHQMEGLLSSFGGEEGSTIITERNKKALAVLKDQLDMHRRRVGVFYGAGHLADMHERIVGEFGLQPEGVTWLTAWDLKKQ